LLNNIMYLVVKIIIVFVTVVILFSSCQKGLTSEDKKEYIAKGKEIALGTSERLGSQLTKSMNEGGVVKALPFCNTMAMPLTDEMSLKYNATIKRTSHKLRNEKNEPTQEETRVLNQYKTLIEANKQLDPIVELDKAGNPHFYAPIVLQNNCLSCHGEIGKNVALETDSIIKSYYPNDVATGFKEGDLRGIWSITFQSE